MALAAFSDDFALYDVTPVENIFLLEYMPYAPGDYVRVYLYGLMMCRYPEREWALEDVAKLMNMEPDQVLDAMRYWEKKGLLEGASDNPPKFLYRNVRSAMLEHPRDENPAYAYSAFNDRLQSVLGLLHPQQFQMAMEWVEDLNLPEDVVLFMAEKTNEMLTLRNGGKQRSIPYIFKALQQRALDWAERGIDSLEKAEAEIQKELPPYQIARMVLDQLNLRRGPTAAETALCKKWLEEWNLGRNDILAALPETTKSANPSFAYLDGILGNRRGQAGQAVGREAVKQVLRALGSRCVTPTDQLIADYEGMLRKGFAPETILRAAALCNSKGQGTFERLGDVLDKWLRLGLTTPEAVAQYLEKRTQLRQLAVRVWDAAGITAEITEASLDQVQEWLSLASPELIEYAAGCAKGLKLPDRSISKRLKEYAEAGIMTPDAAKTFKRPGAVSGRPPEKPKNQALDYSQRDIDEKYFEGIYLNLDEDGDRT